MNLLTKPKEPLCNPKKSIQPRHQKLNMEKWTQLVESWNKREESKQAFCERLNLNINTFNYVQQKLASKKIKLAKQFIPVAIKEELESMKILNQGFVIENTKGIKLIIPANVGLDQLLRLLSLIGWHHA